MAVVYVSEFSGLFTGSGLTGQMANCPPLVEQTVAIGGNSATSGAFNAATSFIRVHTDAICSVAFGTAPTATSSTMRLAAGQTEYFAVPAGSKLAVITNV